MTYKIGNVLSLCDGISCLQIALERAGIRYKNYYACEVDKHAIQCTQTNYPNTIQLGDMSKLDINKLPPIDLVAGGPPCQDFSIAGKRKGLQGERGNLTYTFIDILKKVKPKYWFMENVASMSTQVKLKINKYIRCEPVLINSALVSAQNRKRYYWLSDYFNFCLPEDKRIFFNQISQTTNEEFCYYTDRGLDWIKRAEKKNSTKLKTYSLDDKVKWFTVDTGYAKKYSRQRFWGIKDKLGLRFPTMVECERLQTIPDNYTKMLSNTQRYKAVGNAWTVDVIVHLLHCLLGNTEQLPTNNF